MNSPLTNLYAAHQQASSKIVTAVAFATLISMGTPVLAQSPQKTSMAPQNGYETNASLPPTLTLSEAIDYALRLQPQIATAAATRQQAAERKAGTQSNYYPKVTPAFQYLSQYSFGSVNQFISNNTGGSVTTVQQGSTTTTRTAQVGATFSLFDSGNRELNSRQARQSLRASEYNEANTRQTVVANVADSYFTVLRNEALVRVSEAQVARAQNTRDVVRAQFEAGITAEKDTYQAEADLLNAQVNLLQAQNNAAVSRASLKQAIGAIAGETVRLADVVLPDASTPITATVATKIAGTAAQAVPVAGGGVRSGEDTGFIKNLAATAYDMRPDIAANRQNLEVQKTSESISRVGTGLQVAGTVSATDQFDAVKFNKSIANNRQFNMSLSYPLFDGGFVRSQYRSNQAGTRSAEAQLNSLRQQVAVEVEQAYRNLAQARASLPASAAAVRAARINYDAALASRKEGVGSVVDVITAQTSLVQAETNYVQAIYNFYAADARLARAVGQSDKIGSIGTTALKNASPVQFTNISNAAAPANP